MKIKKITEKTRLSNIEPQENNKSIKRLDH